MSETSQQVKVNRFYLLNEIGQKTLEEFYKEFFKALNESGDKPFELYLTNPGGHVGYGFGLIDSIMSLCPNLKVIGTGLIASMAVPIFLVGSHRVIGPNTRIFLHEIGTSVSKDTRYSISEVRKILAELESHTDRYVEFVSKRTAGKMSTDLIRELMLNDSYLSAQQALEYGLAHQIIDQ